MIIGFDPNLFTKKSLSIFFGNSECKYKPLLKNLVDEIWKIKGSCRSAVSYTTIKIKEYGFADMTVKVKSYGISDKDICIKNPNDAPEWLLEMLN